MVTAVRTAVVAGALFLPLLVAQRPPALTRAGTDGSLGQAIEIRGVRAGPFDPAVWEAGTLNIVPDLRRPLLEPADGKFRNIYAPSLIQERGGWRLFYGAWDGVDTPNDRIYSRWTRDLRTFTDRRLLIDHGAFTHVCNCSAVRLPDGSYQVLATAYPDANGRNKPASFASRDGISWNGSAHYQARGSDIVDLRGYEQYTDADINGMNVLLYEAGLFRMYFADFRNFGTIYRASSRDGHTFTLDGRALAARMAPNDVKIVGRGDRRRYLMALHMNTDRLWYSLSRDGRAFEAPRELARSVDADDRYIVAIGWVVDGDRVLGALYGAGGVPSLDRNRIFGLWLQKRIRFVPESGVAGDARADGPDRLRIPLPIDGPLLGRFELYAEDGRTLLTRGEPVTVRPGEVWQLGGRK